MLDIWNNEIIIVIGINRSVELILTTVDFNSQFFSNAREDEVKRIRVVK